MVIGRRAAGRYSTKRALQAPRALIAEAHCRTLSDRDIVAGPIRAMLRAPYDRPLRLLPPEVSMHPMAELLSLPDVRDVAARPPNVVDLGARARGRVPSSSAAAMDGRIEFEIGTPLADLERRALLATLDFCDGNKKRCAELCGVSLKTLYNRLAAYRKADADGIAR
ncbi:MAG: hypothetical protein HS109_09530 [Burkholderiales bacterium]|nr:hypothetical protein [Burkholderiales bacterium]